MKKNFFEYLDFALQFAPAQAVETEIRAKLARIGVGPGKTVNFTDLSMVDKAEIVLGMAEGERQVGPAIVHAGADMNGWRVAGYFGDGAFYNGNWLLRAAGAKTGIYNNDAMEATYPLTRVDRGSNTGWQQTKLHDDLSCRSVAAGEAFWSSITMYDGRTELLIENPINRYLINSPMLPDMKKNADGSLTIYIQHKSPGADKESNWLPAQTGRSIWGCDCTGRRPSHPRSSR